MKNLLNSYKKTLAVEVQERDLTEGKIKDTAALGLTLGKFAGYNSQMDYYTFRSEFERLVVPRVQAKLLPDFLKTSHLEGQALQLVKEIDSLDAIWERLKLAFGNVGMLLANKLKSTDDSEPLYKVKGDEKVIKALSKLMNLMTELSELAWRHDVEAALYHSSNLAKIYSLLGSKRQSEIVKKLLDKDASEKESWDEIISYIDREIKLKERILLINKCQTTRTEGNERSRSNLSQSSYQTDTRRDPLKCAICDKTDHEPTVTRRGTKVINYFSCEKFVNMTVKQRFEELKRKHLCFQCLAPGFKVGHDGTCFDKYKCPHESHASFPHGLHVLICDKHKQNPENLALLEEYKAKYINFEGSEHKDFSRNMQIFHVDLSSYISEGA